MLFISYSNTLTHLYCTIILSIVLSDGKSTTTVTKTLSDGTTETSQTTVDTPPTPLNTSLTLDHLAGLSADLWQIPTRLRPRVAEAWPLQTPEESTELQSKAIVGENRATERAYEQDSMHEAQGVDSMRAMAAKGFFGGLGAPFGPSL
ncbi:hypothetical protein SARC_16637 [Sphaeroforma arctica JP610]|uniref:Uncharacterized protein n=1 Tax=Sphaeroforma arctica JP610 TaxID=667725 RepID=A0A0L0F2B8_9EUKA|nr:hypothetical protein SARC_16637 [Sphaeroforma arctica JP610]KNC70832.1 hypothetical protein SARC_16637 [Sphaeroforma arctica JP610]|eukprot:XP_014144734.1 hypothetical protein SARC_16637 [Sphaeroforma arctica JP610]